MHREELSGNLNFLETYGPLQACNGTALPLLVLVYVVSHPQAHRKVCKEMRRRKDFILQIVLDETVHIESMLLCVFVLRDINAFMHVM